MRLDRVIQTLLPHDKKFYAFFEESAQNLVAAAEALQEFRHCTPADHPRIVERINDLEHQGDAVTHKIYAELSATFVTPFDREDIHHLASILDDIMDYIKGCASRFMLYKIPCCPNHMNALMEVLRDSAVELKTGISLLRDFRKAKELQEVLRNVKAYENEADSIFEHAIADLFEHEKNAIEIIKLKELYVVLESATDACDDAANIMETLLIKHG